MLQLDHVVFPIRDVERSVAFYRGVLGLELTQVLDGDDWGGYAWLMLIFTLGDGREFVLVNFAGADAPPLDTLPRDGRHVAFAAAGSLEAWKATLDQAGVGYWQEDHDGRMSLYFSDPNDIMLEITSSPAGIAAARDENALARALEWARAHR